MMIGSSNDSAQPFPKAICSICYEDLKPTVEHLQAISNCGHVFHEICIQQWFRYCSKGNEKCPFCNQTCLASNVSKLYFQTVGGESNDPNLLEIRKALEALKLNLRGLKGSIIGLKLALEKLEKRHTDELSVCKEQLKLEKSLKNEAMEQTRTLKRLLSSKTQKLQKSEVECISLQGRNTALVKELAALKLEHKVVSFKCKTLRRDEAPSCKKLEKAREKLQTLMERTPNMKSAEEMKDNEVLRAPKVSKAQKILFVIFFVFSSLWLVQQYLEVD